MAHPAPIYIIEYDNTQLPGYAVSEDIPLSMRIGGVPIIGADGGFITGRGADFRNFRLGMRILSRLSTGTGLQHLDDCMDQWREALAICARVETVAPLYIGDTDRFIMAEFEGSTAPLQAGNTKAISYDLAFKGNPPWFLGDTVEVSTGVGGTRPINITIGDTRKTYPTITIPSGIRKITLSHTASGKSLTLSGTHADPFIVNCATLEITQGGNNAFFYLTSGPDFGMYHEGAGTMTIDASGVVGSGTVGVFLTPRYER